VDLLAGLSKADAARVLACAQSVTLNSGAMLFRLGADADALYNVVRGRISLTLPMRMRGEEQDVLIEERIPGQTLGWSAIVPPYRFTLTATAPLDSEVLAFPRERLTALFAEHPEVGAAVTANVAAIVAQRLHVFQAMWLRQMQQLVELRCA
jgi:CRP-like cAMP-binding protein